MFPMQFFCFHWRFLVDIPPCASFPAAVCSPELYSSTTHLIRLLFYMNTRWTTILPFKSPWPAHLCEEGGSITFCSPSSIPPSLPLSLHPSIHPSTHPNDCFLSFLKMNLTLFSFFYHTSSRQTAKGICNDEFDPQICSEKGKTKMWQCGL